MAAAPVRSHGESGHLAATVDCPVSLSVRVIPGMLNFELADHPVYDGGELQWFDDKAHGTGMLAFLTRRDDHTVDYYVQRGLRLDPADYWIGGGTSGWTEIDFEEARLRVAADGIDAAARFTDTAGRSVEIGVDDRDGKRRRRGRLLAPVSAGIAEPASLLLVWMPAFDLVHVTERAPVVRIAGRDARIGGLPMAWLHRRHLIKYAAEIVAIEFNRSHDGLLARDQHRADVAAGGLGMLVGTQAGHLVELVFDPPLPAVPTVADHSRQKGRWHVEVDGYRLTGGSWALAGTDTRVDLAFDVDERWRPGRLPWLMRAVTTLIPVFRRWPTTYRWRACVQLGDQPSMTSAWQRTSTDFGGAYRRATGSATASTRPGRISKRHRFRRQRDTRS